MDKKLKKVLNLKPHFNIADSIPLYSISDDGIVEIAEGLFSRVFLLRRTKKWGGRLVLCVQLYVYGGQDM